MSNDPITRVHYFPQQFLRTEDFNTEQAYHLDMRRRHNIAHHIWGVVYGLQLVVEEEGLFLQAGMAVDGFGRELILPERFRLPLGEFDAKDSDKLDVWLLYNLRGSEQTPKNFKRCNTQQQEAFNRWQELPAVRLEVPDPGFPDPRRPKPVVEAGDESLAHRRPPDDPTKRWPVFLGRILRDRSDPLQPTYSVDLVGRPVAGLVGDAVVSPSRRAVVLVGDTQHKTESDQGNTILQKTGRFSVALKHQNELQEHLRILGSGELDVFGNTRLHGELKLAGGLNFYTQQPPVDGEFPLENTSPSSTQTPLQRFAGPASGDLLCEQSGVNNETISLPQPWRIYRYRSRRATETGEFERIDQLRIEMGVQGQVLSQVVVGSWSADEEAFKPLLTVDNGGVNGTVTVHGDLVVKGDLTRDAAVSRSRLKPEAQNFLLGTFASGVGGANLQLPEFYKSQFGGGDLDLDSDEGQQQALDFLLQDTDRINRFAAKLLASEFGARGVMNQLSADADVLNEFAQLLTEPTYVGNAPAFANALFDTAAGQEAMFNAMPPESDELNLFATLAQNEFSTWLAAFLETLGNSTLADSLLSTSAGRTALGENLVANNDHINETLAPVIADNSAREILAQLLTANTDGPETILQALPADSPELTAFASLLENVNYADRLPEFVTHILATGEGRTTMGANLTANLDRISDALTPMLDEENARAKLIEEVFSHTSGGGAVGDYLLSNEGEWAEVVDPVLTDDNADSRNELAGQIVTSQNGRVAVADSLEQDAEEFGKLINGDDPDDPNYPNIKDAICV